MPEEKSKKGRTSALAIGRRLPDSGRFDVLDELTPMTLVVPVSAFSYSQHDDLERWASRRDAKKSPLKEIARRRWLPNFVLNTIESVSHADTLCSEQERAQMTLDSIGDAVLSTDVMGRVTYLNGVAESITGWSHRDAEGRTAEEVLKIVNVGTRAIICSPIAQAIGEGRTISLAADCALIRRDGVEVAIEDSISPIYDRHGEVVGAVVVFRDVSAARAMRLRMSHMAQHDGLTELPNRLLFNDRLIQALALAQRIHHRIAVLFLDIDGFKFVNDSMGHDIGDRLLQSAAERLLACVRGADTVSRRGGDEFVVLLAEIGDVTDAGICANKILSALRAPHNIGPHPLYVTASIGIATFPDDGVDATTLLKCADTAMYAAKNGGGDRYEMFRHDMNARVAKRQTLERELRYAAERGGLILVYQPVVDLVTKSIVGIEALVRWRVENNRSVEPGEYVSIEECDFIGSIWRWVVSEACRQARVWQRMGNPSLRMSVNISAVALRSQDFVTQVDRVLAKTGLDPYLLELELSVASLMRPSEATETALRSLKRIGVQLSLGDFGVGYSCLTHLKRFSIDELKIARSFVGSLGANSRDDDIVGAVIAMGRALQIRVVAEGVETREQLTTLLQRGCLVGQGNYLHSPTSAADISRLLRLEKAVRPVKIAPESVLDDHRADALHGIGETPNELAHFWFI